jgi:hypothetical protein
MKICYASLLVLYHVGRPTTWGFDRNPTALATPDLSQLHLGPANNNQKHITPRTLAGIGLKPSNSKNMAVRTFARDPLVRRAQEQNKQPS